MSIITISTPFNIDLEFRVAPFGKRVLAWCVDIVVITIYFYIMVRFLDPLWEKGGEALSSVGAICVIVLPVLLYQLLFELFFNGQTIGKIAVGIKVIDMEGKEPTWGQYALRWILCLGNMFIYIIPFLILNSFAAMIFFMVVYIPDFLSVIISAKSQRLGDLAAGTVVIDKNYVPDITDTIYLQIENKDYVPVFPQVMRLTDRDINGIRNLLNVKKPSKDTEHYIIDVAQKIKTVLGIESDLYPTDFLQQLLSDYNYYTTKG